MEYNKVLVSEVDVASKVVFLRLDLNVPIIDGKITSMKRIKAAIPTIEYLVKNGARVVILSHLGRVKTVDEVKSGKLSLEIVAKEIATEMLPKGASSVTFINKNTGLNVEQLIRELQPGGILVLENTRYKDIGTKRQESSKDAELAQYWANLSDVFINDAYGTAHRDHASTSGIAEYQKNNAIGFLMDEELKHMEKAIDDAKSPFVVIFGGAKVSDKLKAVEKCLLKADKVIISGGMAYTFLKARGYDMGKSNVEDDLLDTARELMARYPDKIVVSNDFECAPEFADVPPTYHTADEGLNGMIGLDIGPKSVEKFKEIIETANTIIWNGPMGVTEFKHYEKGTADICAAIAERTKAGAYTVIGGGDSAAAAEKLGMENSFSWISTGGGATLKFLSGEPLPALIPIRDRMGEEPASSAMLEKEIYGAEDVSVCEACGSEACSGHNSDKNVKPEYDTKIGVNKTIDRDVENGWATADGYSPVPGTSGQGTVPENLESWKQPAPEAQAGQKPEYDETRGVNKDIKRDVGNGWTTADGYSPEPAKDIPNIPAAETKACPDCGSDAHESCKADTIGISKAPEDGGEEHDHEHLHDVIHEHEHAHADGTIHDHFHEHATEHDHVHAENDDHHTHEHQFESHEDHDHNVDHDHPDDESNSDQTVKFMPV